MFSWSLGFSDCVEVTEKLSGVRFSMNSKLGMVGIDGEAVGRDVAVFDGELNDAEVEDDVGKDPEESE